MRRPGTNAPQAEPPWVYPPPLPDPATVIELTCYDCDEPVPPAICACCGQVVA